MARTILVVDDEPTLRETLVDALEADGFRVVSAADGREALLRFRADKPDLILLDLNLPKKDGREVLSVIKNDGQLKHIPVVVLTTSRAEEDVLRSYHLHANCYVVKPVDLEKFIQVVQAIDRFWLAVVTLPPSQ